MSKKVNIMADVEQNVYDAVVVPHKQSRSFTTLIETLLEGYYANSYIRSFVDDKIAGVQQESSDVLNDIISNMHKGLANMGVLTDDMKATAQDGIDAFSKKAEETREEMKDIQSEEIKSIREGMEELREQVRTQNEEILGMLKTLMSGNIIQVNHSKEPYFDPFKAEEKSVEEVVVKDEVEDEVLYDLSGNGESPLVNAIEMLSEESSVSADDSSEDTITSEEEANDIMANLLVGQVYSF